MDNVRIIVAGSRNFNKYRTVRLNLDNIIDNIIHNSESSHIRITIVSGCAKGPDRLGEQYAKFNHYNLRKFPAEWNEFGKSAGYIRNKQMAEYASKQHGVLVAFWDGESKGTKHMIDLAYEYGIEVHVIQI